jgi:hypothetical protein
MSGRHPLLVEADERSGSAAMSTAPRRMSARSGWIGMGRYDALVAYFEASLETEETLTFARIEKILGGPLPASARKYAPFGTAGTTSAVCSGSARGLRGQRA